MSTKIKITKGDMMLSDKKQEDYLKSLMDIILTQEKNSVGLTRGWAKSLPDEAGVYAYFEGSVFSHPKMSLKDELAQLSINYIFKYQLFFFLHFFSIICTTYL